MYFNTLIIMNEDALGYGNRASKPSGYCKLTMPNRVSCYVQGLRQLPKGQIYKLYLTSKSRQKSVEVGMLQVGANGNKETRWVMNPASINNTGVKAEEIDGAFIIVSGDGIKGNVVPLVGFSSEPYIWEHLVKNNKQTVKSQEEEEPVVVVKAQEEEEPVVVVKAQEEEEPVEVAKAQEEAEPVVVVKAQEEEEPVVVAKAQEEEESSEASQIANPGRPPEITPMAEVGTVFSDEGLSWDLANANRASSDEILQLKEEIIRLNQTIQESKAIIEELQGRQESKAITEELQEQPTRSEETTGINDYINNFIRKFQSAEKKNLKDKPKDDLGDNLRGNYAQAQDIFEKRIPINPFEAQDTGIKWVRITHDDLTSLPSLDREWTNQAMMMEAHRDYKHFILGKDESGLTYYVGIPDVFNPTRESALNIDKIERFSCCHNVPPKVGEAGYWIARI